MYKHGLFQIKYAFSANLQSHLPFSYNTPIYTFTMKNKGYFLTALSGILFGFTPILFSFAIRYGTNTYTNTWIRGVIVLLVSVILSRFRKTALPLQGPELSLLFLSGFCCLFTILLLGSSYSHIGVGMATSLHFLYPVFISILLAVFWKNRMSLQQIIALVLSVIGMAFLAGTGETGSLAGILLALCSGLTHAIYMILLDRTVLKDLPAETVLLFTGIVISIALFFGSFLFPDTLRLNLPLPAYLFMILYGLCAYAGHAILKKGIAIIGSQPAGLLSMLEPVSSIFFGILFLNETRTVAKSIGIVILLVSILLVLLDRSDRQYRRDNDHNYCKYNH